MELGRTMTTGLLERSVEAEYEIWVKGSNEKVNKVDALLGRYVAERWIVYQRERPESWGTRFRVYFHGTPDQLQEFGVALQQVKKANGVQVVEAWGG